MVGEVVCRELRHIEHLLLKGLVKKGLLVSNIG
jgi:hypothetical protein